jgi:shikimate kinase
MDPSEPLRARTITLVGLMGSGKSSVGKRLAQALDLPFRDADDEVETAARRSIPEIFEQLGEPAFRDGERRVIARLLEGPPIVLATGGGAFMNSETREIIKARSVSVWLKADLPILAKRVARKDNRPLLTGKDPLVVLTEQAAVRYPAYAQADITVETGDTPHQVSVDQVVRALTNWQSRSAA